MADDGFSLDDALTGQTNTSGVQTQGQNWNNPWGGQNPGQQQYPGGGFPGQQYPGFPGQAGQQYPGAPPAGQQYPGAPPAGQQYPGAPPAGQQYPGAPPAGQQFPGFPGFPGYPAPGQTYPGAPTPGQPGQTGPVPSAPTGPLKVPHDLTLPTGLVPRLLITFQGSIAPNAKRFTVDFKKGRDICFHFNPRFDENPNVIVRNSMIREQWGKEERQGRFPFQRGQPFTLQFFCETDKLNVTVNNESICQFQHRVREFNEIKSVSISGEITLTGATATVV
ncbi:galectin-3 [Mixophyes fleayi]|uniref:galectin-3 n=1 Tax=Mixophyes fleayi TaxID=3061075 RepID=UPI003F4DC97F